ncbi:MAG TPA: peptide-N-glycosidase F-related protein, partial [candidate division Zixibacteria bacterium]|nr:peptide-N-glycosidase F-related protein [candidate division Zixibacteria bacterium]
MRKILSLSIITFAITLVPGRPLWAGETVHVKSHDKVKVVTDPSKGYNSYPAWAVFPSDSTQYRKVTLYVTYACPDTQHCGEWDYIDNVLLRRTGGESGKVKDIELARLISPYGWQFDSTWSFTWHVDITDFSFLLHDSVQIEFRHGGYEKNDDRGWLITLDFAVSEGRPAVQVLGMDSLWCGTIPYGDPAKPTDSTLEPISFTDTNNATMARLRILQTGHGMDDMENCAEFCSKWRQVYFDDSLIDQRQIWRKCGENPLYPQAGT